MRKLLLTMIVCLLLGAPAVCGAGQQVYVPQGFSPVQYKVEELSANLYEDGALLVVSGKIKNASHRDLQGDVIVYLKNGADEVIHAIEGEVNNKRPFSHGAEGYFELSANISDLPQLSNVAVDFISK